MHDKAGAPPLLSARVHPAAARVALLAGVVEVGAQHPSAVLELDPLLFQLLRFSAESNACRVTFRRSTAAGTVIPCSRPSVLTHMHREL